MATLEELQSLTNEQLRLSLIENGLGTFPVTQTTRKVLVQKLFKKLNSTDAKKPARPRTPNKRHTIAAAPAVTAFSSDDEPEPPAARPVTRKRTPERREIIIPVVRTDVRDSNVTRRTRATPPRKPVLVDLDSDLNEEEDRASEESEEEEEIVVPPPTPPRTMRGAAVTNRNYSSSTTTTTSKTTKLGGKGGFDEFDFGARKDEYRGGFVPSSGSAATNRRTTIGPGLSTSRYGDFGGGGGITSPSVASRWSSSRVDTENNGLMDETTTPYLSDFTRRLTQLKAESLDPVVSADKPTSMRYYRTGARFNEVEDESITASLRDIWNALTAYKIHFFLFFIFFFIVFVLVMIYV